MRQSYFTFQNNPHKNLDSSYKKDLDFWGDCFGRVLLWKDKTRIIAKFHRTDLVIYSHSREGKTLSYN